MLPMVEGVLSSLWKFLLFLNLNVEFFEALVVNAVVLSMSPSPVPLESTLLYSIALARQNPSKNLPNSIIGNRNSKIVIV